MDSFLISAAKLQKIFELCKFKVTLSAIYVCFDHFDFDGVAQSVRYSVLGADESVVFLIVLPVFSREADIGDMNETFAARIIELDEESEVGDTGNMSVENLAYMVGEPDGLEEFDGVTFSLRGFLFAGGTMLAHEFHFFTIHGLFFAG